MNEALHALETGARLGYLARAVVYFMIGTLALMAGLGYGGETEDPKDALRDLFRQPFGEVLVIAAAAGLAGYGLWRLLMAVRDPEHALYADEGRAQRIGRRLGYVGSGLANLSLAAFALSLQFPRLVPFGHGGSGDGTRDWTARLLRVPAGEWLVAGVGVVFLITAAVFAVRAWKAGFCKTLAPEAQRPLIVNLCRIGIGARAVVFALIGVFLIVAAWRADPREARGLGASLAALREQPAGEWLLAAVGAGLMAFAFFSLIEACWRRIRTQ